MCGAVGWIHDNSRCGIRELAVTSSRGWDLLLLHRIVITLAS
jgi:hypothetical protein